MEIGVGTRADTAGERGVVIVISMLVLLSLAGIAIVATHRVSLEIDRAGNYRLQKNAAVMAQLGTMLGLARLSRLGAAVAEEMQGALDTAPVPEVSDTGKVTNPNTLRLNLASYGETDLMDLEGDTTGINDLVGAGGSFGRKVEVDDVDFVTTVEVLGEVDGAVPGYSSGEFSFSRVVMTTTGSFRMPGGTAMAQNQKRAFLLMGPIATPQIER